MAAEFRKNVRIGFSLQEPGSITCKQTHKML
jgi:hypothetical protein